MKKILAIIRLLRADEWISITVRKGEWYGDVDCNEEALKIYSPFLHRFIKDTEEKVN